MSRFPVSAIANAIGAVLLTVASAAQAVPLNNAFVAESYLDTGLGGTTVAVRPELAGLVVADTVQPFDFGALGITGTVQSRVVKEDVAGTLDFYWRIIVDPNSRDGVSAFRLDDFGYANLTDADWRIDGLGSAAPYIGRLFNPAGHPEGAINFLFTDPPVQPGDPAENSNGSRFFFLHTDALFFAETASFDLLPGVVGTGISPSYKTYAPAIPEPSSVLLLGLGLAGTGLAGKRRRSS